MAWAKDQATPLIRIRLGVDRAAAPEAGRAATFFAGLVGLGDTDEGPDDRGPSALVRPLGLLEAEGRT